MEHQEPDVHRTIVVVDVERFGDLRRSNRHQVAVRKVLYRAVRRAFEDAGILWTDCYCEDRGDGLLILAPADLHKAPFVDLVPHALVPVLGEHNATRPAAEHIRLRMALHAGEVAYDAHGVTGVSINMAFRLLDAECLKAALAESHGVLALITSGWFFEEVVRHSHWTDPTTFRPVRVAVKETSTTAWISLPDHPYPPDAQHLTGEVDGDVQVVSRPVTRRKGRLLIGAATVVVLTAGGDSNVPPLSPAAGQDRLCGQPQLADGPILDKYRQQWADGGFTLGCPLEPVTATADGRGQFAVFDTTDKRYSDRIYWSQDTGAHMVLGEIGLKWAAMDAQSGQLGFPKNDEQHNRDPGELGRSQEFQGGWLYWHPQRSRGAHPISGEFFVTWGKWKSEVGPLGYPISDVRPSSDRVGQYQDFEGGAIVAHPTYGTHAVMIKIYQKWQRHGAEAGDYGYPVADEVPDGRTYRQMFERDAIIWDDATQDYR